MVLTAQRYSYRGRAEENIIDTKMELSNKTIKQLNTHTHTYIEWSTRRKMGQQDAKMGQQDAKMRQHHAKMRRYYAKSDP
jgi:hypothetical protein